MNFERLHLLIPASALQHAPHSSPPGIAFFMKSYGKMIVAADRCLIHNSMVGSGGISVEPQGWAILETV
jgi:hypothetical protein